MNNSIPTLKECECAICLCIPHCTSSVQCSAVHKSTRFNSLKCAKKKWIKHITVNAKNALIAQNILNMIKVFLGRKKVKGIVYGQNF